ncbi:hypothetical protein HDF12_003934 [Edaphobacter lichenicola]|uniref:Uncharacterized protein n=1 Tax=Tunturiibacter lichenicola TaxID=2051959 RepID=A0A7Y9TBX2_9BACT|nr:hypothetical protein [Edaphobacter lichenicola]
MLINQPQQMILWYLIIQSEVVEQRFRAGVLTIMSVSPPTMMMQTAWSNYAADHLPLPYESHENQLIRTDFFNTHAC